MKKYLAAAVAATALISTAAWATVTFDTESGTGFVGKGDVQLAFGWNNSQLQSNASGVSFSYDSVDTYEATCTFYTGQEGTPGYRVHNIDIPRHSTVSDQIQYDARTHKQIDGFILTGFWATTTQGTAPVVGDTCVAEDSNGVAQNGTWTEVDLISSSGGTLSVNYGGTSVPLAITPTA